MACRRRRGRTKHTLHERWWHAGGGEVRARAGAKRLGGASGGVGLREVVRARLEAVDAPLDVLRVRVDGRGHDLGEVVREVVRGVEARVV